MIAPHRLLAGLGAGLLTLGAGVIKAEPEGPTHRNVLLLCVDDLRSVMGHLGGAAKTPHMDRFVSEGNGVSFSRHYNQWPVCGPSRASMLSGLRPDTSGTYQIGESWKISQMPDTAPTMPLHFRRAGYHSQSFGKIYHGPGWGEGFGWSVDPWRPDSWACYVEYPYPQLIEEAGDNKKVWMPAYEIYDGPDSLHNDYETATRVIQAMEENRDRPFFIAGGFYKPHLPFVAPQRYWDMYDPDEISLLDFPELPAGAGDYMYQWTELNAYGIEEGVFFETDQSPTEEQMRDMIHAYYAAVSFIDAQIGRVLDRLEELELHENTAVVIWSDHGFHLGDQARWGKHTQFEESMRCPLLMRLPGEQTISGVSDAIVESLDIYNTVVEYAGLDAPPHLEGESLLPVLQDENPAGRAVALSQIQPVSRAEHHLMSYSVRTDRFRYVEWRDTTDDYRLIWRELYDLAHDQQETQNLAEKSAHLDIVKEHARIVRDNFSTLSHLDGSE